VLQALASRFARVSGTNPEPFTPARRSVVHVPRRASGTRLALRARLGHASGAVQSVTSVQSFTSHGRALQALGSRFARVSGTNPDGDVQSSEDVHDVNGPSGDVMRLDRRVCSLQREQRGE
jgi:hypothetical protein